jgi:dipeptidyl aminopeptidase/acylaminoacyl peptidase
VLLASGILYQNGFNVLAMDMRDHGDSTCEDGYYSAGQKESDDSASVVNWLVEEKNIQASNIGIYGQSLGALTTLQTGAKTQNFAAIALHDPPVDFGTLVREEMEFQGFPPVLYTPVNHYARIFKGENLTEVTPAIALENGNKQPILVFNGKLDKRVLAHHTDDLIKLANDNGIEITTYRYDDMGHVESLWGYNDEFSQAIVSFFNENLGS